MDHRSPVGAMGRQRNLLPTELRHPRHRNRPAAHRHLPAGRLRVAQALGRPPTNRPPGCPPYTAAPASPRGARSWARPWCATCWTARRSHRLALPAHGLARRPRPDHGPAHAALRRTGAAPGRAGRRRGAATVRPPGVGPDASRHRFLHRLRRPGRGPRPDPGAGTAGDRPAHPRRLHGLSRGAERPARRPRLRRGGTGRPRPAVRRGVMHSALSLRLGGPEGGRQRPVRRRGRGRGRRPGRRRAGGGVAGGGDRLLPHPGFRQRP